MKKFLSLCMIMAFVLIGAANVKAEGWYGALKAGVSFQDIWSDHDSFGSTSFAGAGALGYDFYPRADVPVRMEVEYAIRTSAASDDDFHATNHGVMALGYYDFRNNTDWTPFVGVGLGMNIADGSYDNGRSKEFTETSLAWAATTGVAYAFNKRVSAELAYRYTGYDGYNVDDGDDKIRGNMHEIMAGLRLNF